MDLRVWLRPRGESGQRCGREKECSAYAEIISRLAWSVCAFVPTLGIHLGVLPSSQTSGRHYLQLSYKTLYVYRHLAAGIAGILVNLDLRSETFIFGVSSNYVDTSPVIVEMKKAICIDFCPS